LKLVVRPGAVEGKVKAPPSKSYAIRALICSLLADGPSTLENLPACDDVKVVVKACEILGGTVERVGDRLLVKGPPSPSKRERQVYCGGSATAIRFLTALSATIPGLTLLDGDETLRRRPIDGLIDALSALGFKCSYVREHGKPPVLVSGGAFKGGSVMVDGSLTSHYVSALLLISPRSDEGVLITVKGDLVSRGYVDMTISTLKSFGVSVFRNGYKKFFVPGSQLYRPTNYTVEGDYSLAACLLAAGLIAGKVTVEGLNPHTRQPDRKIIEIAREMGGTLKASGNSVTAEKSELKGVKVDARDVPDLVPILAVLGAYASGETKITNVERLRFKESDRVTALLTELSKMGVKITYSRGEFVIRKSKVRGAKVAGHKDHRIVMACTVAALGAEGETVIEGVEHVSKSYPNFVEDFLRTGATVRVVK